MRQQLPRLCACVGLILFNTGCVNFPTLDGAAPPLKCDAAVGKWKYAGPKGASFLRCDPSLDATGSDYHLFCLTPTEKQGPVWVELGDLSFYFINGRKWCELSKPMPKAAWKVWERPRRAVALVGTVAFTGHRRLQFRNLTDAWLSHVVEGSHPSPLPYYYPDKSNPFIITVTATPKQWYDFVRKDENLRDAFSKPFVLYRVGP